ncbi:Hpt domain-containing protein [Vibrio sp. ZSDZ34]|jgi:HPt (histidine-containing phosphotransfer) domain-containing protein|uniref:Hpt domain-containing protein n=1 Tax=Vibrio gelatinilyticus TaxID=2893468 RepID=A0A9X1W798_9VIBR|nr:Hpt domain-containing protein [Vibrio gelatinilyticus]MCJ2375243.1 Hpt domain-containing protein [Vibrio gelatinilyticus]
MINFDVLREYMDNDDEIILAVFQAYIEEHNNSAETIEALYAVQDWPQLFIAAHSLKGILASFGEEETVTRLENIEGMSRDNTAPDKADIDAAIEGLNHINVQINDYFVTKQ